MHKVFVYGTLKQGHHNHRVFGGEQKLLGSFTTTPDFTMVHLGGFPGVLDDGDTPIVGEVYEVDDAAFHRLDLLEGYPTMYGRKEITTDYGDAWMYIYNTKDSESHNVISSGEW